MGNCVGSKGGKKDPKKLTDEEIKLLMDNTRLTKPQILALHRNFLKECPSGKLTKKDFVKLFKEVHPSDSKKEKADKFCEYVFKVIDKQKLGYISFQEFVLCFILTSDGDFKDKCEFAFQLYDLDKDNKISKKEMTQVLTALYDLSGITDRKGNNAPAKKVDDIIRKINAEHKAAEVVDVAADKKAKKEKPAKPVKEPKPGKEAKPGKAVKPAKPAKGPEYITKDQFIAACNADEQIKQLFVDSIFCGGPDAGLSFTTPAVTGGDLSLAAPAVTVQSRSVVSVDGVDVVDTANDSNVLKFEMPTLSASVEAPAVEVKAEAPSVEVNAEAPVVSVATDAPAVAVDAPAAEVSVTAPSVEVKETKEGEAVAAN